MPFDDRIKNIITPQRVLALCKLVQYEKLSKAELKDYLEPPGINQKQDKFSEIFNFAVKGELVFEDVDGKIATKLSKNDLASPASFRQAIAKRTFLNPGLVFCRFTSWYLARGEKVYMESSATLAEEFDREVNLAKDINIYNETNITAWRTWANYLGFGFVHSAVLIPNVAVRVQDCLAVDKELKRNQSLLFTDFMKWLAGTCPELDGGPIYINNQGAAVSEEQHLSVALSFGLRALHDAGQIKLDDVRDATNVWYLTEVENHQIPSKVSQISINGGDQ